MPSTVSGVALHPLLVHAVVVLVPLSVLAAIACVFSRRVRDRYGWLFVGLATLALFFVPLASATGEALYARVHLDPLIRQHAQLGGQLLPLMFLLWASLLALMLLHRWGSLPSDGPGTPSATSFAPSPLAQVDRVGTKLPPLRRRRLERVVAAVTVLLAVVTGVWCYRIGDTGARAVWHGRGTGPVINQEEG